MPSILAIIDTLGLESWHLVANLVQKWKNYALKWRKFFPSLVFKYIKYYQLAICSIPVWKNFFSALPSLSILLLNSRCEEGARVVNNIRVKVVTDELRFRGFYLVLENLSDFMSSLDKGFKHESIDTLWRRALSNSLVFLSLPPVVKISYSLLRLSYHTSKCNFIPYIQQLIVYW